MLNPVVLQFTIVVPPDIFQKTLTRLTNASIEKIAKLENIAEYSYWFVDNGVVICAVSLGNPLKSWQR